MGRLTSREKILILTLFILAVVVILGGIWAIRSGRSRSSADAPALPNDSNTSQQSTSSSTKNESETNSADTVIKSDLDKPVISLQPGFNLIGVPYILSPNDGKTVLLGLSTKEAYYLNSEGVWISLFESGIVRPGEGYWINSEKGEAYTLLINQATAIDSAKPFTVTLKTGWNSIANPYNKSIIWNPSVKTSKGTTSFKKAVEAKIVTVGYISDPISKAYKIINAGDTLKANQGMLIKSGGDVELTINASQ